MEKRIIRQEIIDDIDFVMTIVELKEWVEYIIKEHSDDNGNDLLIDYDYWGEFKHWILFKNVFETDEQFKARKQRTMEDEYQKELKQKKLYEELKEKYE